jgi:hypothetical protein
MLSREGGGENEGAQCYLRCKPTKGGEEMKKGFIVFAGFFMLITMNSPAKALVIDNWQLNLTGIDGIGNQVVSPINQISYFGPAHVTVTDVNDDKAWNVGEIATVNGLLSASGYFDKDGSQLFGTGIGDDYQLTFVYRTYVYNYLIDPISNNISFAHVPGGFLDIYVDGATDGISVANGDDRTGYDDGVKIASFEPVAGMGEGGVFHPATFNGTDDGVFRLTWAESGVILDARGNDLASLPNILFAITDGDLSVSRNNFNPLDFIAAESGRTRLAVVPEPSSMLLVGFGLLGFGVFSRRRAKK